MIGLVGDLTLDLAVRSTGPLQLGSDVVGEIAYQGGGSAANCAAWLGRLGSPVRFGCAIGPDFIGAHLVAELEEYGVELAAAVKDEPTGAILLFVDEEGERTMVTSRGANLQLTPADLSSGFFTGLKHLHLTGYSFFGSENVRKTAEWALAEAHRRGISVSIDPSSYALLQVFGIELFLRLTAGADLIFPNFDEGRMLTGATEPEAVVRQLLSRYPMVVLTLGRAGCLCGHQGEVTAIDGREVEAVDTTGAGDAFAAGFLHALQQGVSLVECARLGVETASLCVQQRGGRPPKTSGKAGT